MECGHTLFPLVDCLMLQMRQPDHYQHHNRNNGSNATITLLKVTTLFKNNKGPGGGERKKDGSIKGILGSRVSYMRGGITFF